MGRLTEAASGNKPIGKAGLEEFCKQLNDRRQARGIKTFYTIDRNGPVWRLVEP